MQCVTVVSCSGTTPEHVPCCDWSSYRWDALCSHSHSAAADVHNPQPQQQSQWVLYKSINILQIQSVVIKQRQHFYCVYVVFVPPGLHDMLFGMWVSLYMYLMIWIVLIMQINKLSLLIFVYFSRQHSQSRENINFPEDEMVRGSDGGIEDIGGLTSPGKITTLWKTTIFSFCV